MAKESEKLYRYIIEGDYDSRLKRSLRNIKEICDEREKHGARIFIGRVGKLCQEEFGGPAAQSIRNQPSTLKRYVDLRAGEQLLPEKVRSKENKLKITDPKVRAYVSILEEQVRDYEEDVRRVKKLFERISPVEIDKLTSEAVLNNNPLMLPPILTTSGKSEANAFCLSKTARQALEKITDENHLKLSGLTLYKGRVLSVTSSYKFLSKDEYQALLDLLVA